MRAADVWEMPKRCPISPRGVAVSAYSWVTSSSCSSVSLRARNTRLAALGAGVDGARSCSVERSLAVVVIVIESAPFHVAYAVSLYVALDCCAGAIDHRTTSGGHR